jgi:hypothetical protein
MRWNYQFAYQRDRNRSRGPDVVADDHDDDDDDGQRY